MSIDTKIQRLSHLLKGQLEYLDAGASLNFALMVL